MKIFPHEIRTCEDFQMHAKELSKFRGKFLIENYNNFKKLIPSQCTHPANIFD